MAVPRRLNDYQASVTPGIAGVGPNHWATNEPQLLQLVNHAALVVRQLGERVGGGQRDVEFLVHLDSVLWIARESVADALLRYGATTTSLNVSWQATHVAIAVPRSRKVRSVSALLAMSWATWSKPRMR